MCARIYKIFMNRQKTLFLLFMFEVGEIWVGICRSIKRSREIFFLVLFISLFKTREMIHNLQYHLSLCGLFFLQIFIS